MCDVKWHKIVIGQTLYIHIGKARNKDKGNKKKCEKRPKEENKGRSG